MLRYITILTSKYFDRDYYMEHNPDVKKAGINPVSHYLSYGWKEGRNPSIFFDGNAYLNAHADVKKSHINPLLHYEKYGKKERRAIFETKDKNAYENYTLIRDSKYFDAKWYLHQYPDVKKARINPARHYLLDGWKEGRDPSKSFISNLYVEYNRDVKINPLLHYEKFGRIENRKFKDTKKTIVKKQKNKGVVYTCITGGYDNLIQHRYVDLDWDYVCFSDDAEMLNKKQIGHWEVRKIIFSELDNIRNSRWHKTHPHELFPEHDYSVWVDGNINVSGSFLFKKVKNCIKDENLISVPLHPARYCIYQEIIAVEECKLEAPETLDRQREFLEQESYPSLNGLNETNIIFRFHNNKIVINIMENWFNVIKNLSKRDQLSFNYALWKSNYNMVNLANEDDIRRNTKNFILQSGKNHSGKLSIDAACYSKKLPKFIIKSKTKGSSLLVHLHLFYQSQLDFFIKNLRNITIPYDLYVTITEYNDQIAQKLIRFKKDVNLLKVENCGFDVYPFLQVINQINLENYKYILKLHTKNGRGNIWNKNGVNYQGFQWRNDLISPLIGSKRVFKRNISLLKTDNIGMLGSANLLSNIENEKQVEPTKGLCSRFNVEYRKSLFVCGTMFFAKTDILKQLTNTFFTEDDFVSTNKTGDTGSLAHSFETFFGILVETNKKSILGVHSLKTRCKSLSKFFILIHNRFFVKKYKNDLTYIEKSRYFNKRWYLKQNSSLIPNNMSPAAHYFYIGWKEGLNPGRFFCTNSYLELNNDVKKAEVNPLLHYEKHGKREGRRKSPAKIKKKSFVLNRYKDHNIQYINKEYLNKLIEKHWKIGIKNHKRGRRVIVSLTSFPERMADIHYTLYSLLTQAYKPDMIILWLGVEKFPGKEKDLPNEVIRLLQYGISIMWVNDIRSYTKLIPALQIYPNDIIVTADDDIYYQCNWLKKLIREYIKNRNYIHCHRAHRLKLGEDKLLPYNTWDHNIKNIEPSLCNFLTGVGGVLYPPHSLDCEVFNEACFKKLSPYADDVWFWAMAIKNGTKINVISNPLSLVYTNPQRELRETSDFTLAKLNTGEDKNDEQLNNVLEYYDLYTQIGLKRK